MAGAVIGWKAWCAVVLVAGMRAGGIVAVQKQTSPKPAQAAPAKQPGAGGASRPRVARPEQAARPAATILDCPVIGSPFSANINPVAGLPPFASTAGTDVPSGFGFGVGGGAYPPLPPVISPPALPAVPEPATWAMLVEGFGLVGLSCRRVRPTDRPAA